jgi:two-component system, cell cycle response regulator DivK
MSDSVSAFGTDENQDHNILPGYPDSPQPPSGETQLLANERAHEGPPSSLAASRADHVTRPERRRKRRVLISAPVRVRGLNATDGSPDEISTTVDVSRIGILFLTRNQAYRLGMELAVAFPYSETPSAIHAEQRGLVVRLEEMSDGCRAVGIAIGKALDDRPGSQLVDAAGRSLLSSPEPTVGTECPPTKRPLVLAVDSDDTLREALRSYLTDEGYEVIAVSNCPDARDVLNILIPSLLIAEVEGEGLPGFELCAHVKSTERLCHIPVVLTTRSGYPSDYSNAHSLGAVVCMSKPFKQERLGHVVRLLAPSPQAKLEPPPQPRAAFHASQKARPRGDASTRRWRFGL